MMSLFQDFLSIFSKDLWDGEPRSHSNYPKHREYEKCIYFQVKLDDYDDNDDDDGGCNDTMKVVY